eukprot:CAMPEP_0194338478 /NCGR_PEP_ID=MMETSP0171-20130528/79721_1 /TAXON_ID=218684 /ORGANISM="Corethron pennatum, Strain L29A3" /LENGTH=297 /DNA_ID=CAMNT_0039102625 /DNA_START=246 /DNA_END=1135 /DNA_ORIENTATION=-
MAESRCDEEDDDTGTDPFPPSARKPQRGRFRRSAAYFCGLLVLALSVARRSAGAGDGKSTTIHAFERTRSSDPDSGHLSIPAGTRGPAATGRSGDAPSRTPDRASIRAAQIANYRGGSALVIALHITHHGGTTLCRAVGRASDASRPAPSLSCNYGSRWPREDPGRPWIGAEETARAAAALGAAYHFVGWEFRGFPGRGALGGTHWEDPGVVSVVVLRDPLSRLLAGTGYFGHRFGYGPERFTRADWWAYARSAQTDNYALRILAADRGCCAGADTERRHLEAAKALISRTTYVLDL